MEHDLSPHDFKFAAFDVPERAQKRAFDRFNGLLSGSIAGSCNGVRFFFQIISFSCQLFYNAVFFCRITAFMPRPSAGIIKRNGLWNRKRRVCFQLFVAGSVKDRE